MGKTEEYLSQSKYAEHRNVTNMKPFKRAWMLMILRVGN